MSTNNADRMLSNHVPGCRKQDCECYGANPSDSKGRADERRKAKRRERQAWKKELTARQETDTINP